MPHGERMPAHRLQEEIAGKPGRERSRRKIERIDAEHIVMRLIAGWRAGAGIGIYAPCVRAADEASRSAGACAFGKAVCHG